MTYLTPSDAQAWIEETKLPITAIATNLESQVAVEIMGRLSSAFTTTSWVDSGSTPPLIRKLIAMRYVAWIIQRTYAEDEGLNPYAQLLISESNSLIEGLISGSVTIPGLADGINQSLGTPAFYPTDASSSQCPTFDDSSLGGSRFSMGQRF